MQNAVNNGLLNGIDGKIAAGENLTRAQMAAIVTRAFGTNGKANISSFGDVNAGDWFYDAMASSVLMGAFQGDGVNLNPNANITRQEAFTVLARLFTLSGGDQSVLSRYTDGAQVADWAKDSMASMVAAGYVKGSDNMLNPQSSITRAEFAQVMDNLVKTYFADSRLNVNANGNAVLNKAGTLEGATISGDLIIGDGAAEGDVVLKNVTVSGRLLVRGGGTSTVTLGGNTTVGSIAVNKPTGAVRVKNNTQKTVNVNALSDNVVLTGGFNEVNANASQGTVTLTGATVATMNVAGTRAKVVVSEKSTVETMNVKGSASGAAVSVQSGTNVKTMNTAASKAVVTVNGTVNTMSVAGSDTTVKAEEGAKIEKITTSAAKTTVSGKGSVANFEAAKGSSGADITTDGTKVVNNGTGNVTTGNDKVIASGSTGASKSDSTTPGGGGSTSDDGGSVDTVAPTVQSMAIDGVEVANGSTYYFGGDKTAFTSLTATMSEGVSLVKDAAAEVKVYRWTDGTWKDQSKNAGFDVSGNKLTLKNIELDGNGQNFAAGKFKFEVAAGTLQDAAGNKNEALTWEITFEKDETAPTATNLVINGQDVANGGKYYFNEGAVVNTMAVTMSESVELAKGDSGVVKVNNDTTGDEWADYATFTVAKDGKTLNLTIKDDAKIVAGTFSFKIELDTLKDSFNNTNKEIIWEVTFEKLNESGAVTVTNLAGLKSALSSADVKTVTVDGDIQMTEDLTINKGVTLTVNETNKLTVAADATVVVNGTVTGTIEGTSQTSKLVIGESGSYNDLSVGTYIYKDKWVNVEDLKLTSVATDFGTDVKATVGEDGMSVVLSGTVPVDKLTYSAKTFTSKEITLTVNGVAEKKAAVALNYNAKTGEFSTTNGTFEVDGTTYNVSASNLSIAKTNVTPKARENGPAAPIKDTDYDYAAAYGKAGVTFSGGTNAISYTVDAATLAKFCVSENENDIKALTQKIEEKNYLFVGIQFDTPADIAATKAMRYINGKASTEEAFDLSADGETAYKKNPMAYIAFGSYTVSGDGATTYVPVASAANKYEVVTYWMDNSGNILAVNFSTVTRNAPTNK